ncbi:MAG: hypothetical protein ABT20_02900 [Rubrivivax sp. SCN 70-15]|nr:MAG: hypothetical protein ABT20_02900 [Rubrivivax sp. SCN 70-15]
MTTQALERLIWTLIYGGLLVVCLGIFVLREHVPIGAALVTVGAIAAGVGAVLIWVRSRMHEPPASSTSTKRPTP